MCNLDNLATMYFIYNMCNDSFVQGTEFLVINLATKSVPELKSVFHSWPWIFLRKKYYDHRYYRLRNRDMKRPICAYSSVLLRRLIRTIHKTERIDLSGTVKW